MDSAVPHGLSDRNCLFQQRGHASIEGRHRHEPAKPLPQASRRPCAHPERQQGISSPLAPLQFTYPVLPTFFAQAKKVGPPRRAAPCVGDRMPRPRGHGPKSHRGCCGAPWSAKTWTSLTLTPTPLPQGEGLAGLSLPSAAGSGTPPGTSPAHGLRRHAPRRRGTAACACVPPTVRGTRCAASPASLGAGIAC